ncbi:MAG TPA: hypothetical protein VMS98_15095 [Thermoanaerobaculia bacterium]|nr:hypothetical protein [Thermoanaerobaculia bacterium]
MKLRALIWLTAIVSSILGGLAVYLALSVPNDLKADQVLKNARQDIEKGNTAAARESLSRIIQQYPRTDAAAAATLALIRLGDQDRARLQSEVVRLREEYEEELADVRRTVDAVAKAPPKVVTTSAPAPKKSTTTAGKKTTPKKTTTTAKKKTTPKKKTTTKRKR